MTSKTSPTVTIPRELACQIDAAVWRMKRFADYAETVAVTLKNTPPNPLVTGFQIEMLLNLHEDMIAEHWDDIENSIYGLADCIETADAPAAAPAARLAAE